MSNGQQNPKNDSTQCSLYGTLFSHFDQHNKFVWSSIPILFAVQAAVIGGSWAVRESSYTVASGVAFLGCFLTLSVWLYMRKSQADRDHWRPILNTLFEKLQKTALSSEPMVKEITTNLRPKARTVLLVNFVVFFLLDWSLGTAFLVMACQKLMQALGQ